MTSPQDVTSYIVLWWKGSAVIGRSDALSDTTTYNIKGLDSNSAYQVIVQARGLLGNSSSDFKELHTMPNQIQGINLLVTLSVIAVKGPITDKYTYNLCLYLPITL